MVETDRKSGSRAKRARKDGVPHIVIVGGGFAGLYAARVFRRARVRITLVDRRNHHLFTPLLYQVATCGLNPSDIASPLRQILRDQKNVEVLLAEAREVRPEAKRVLLADGAIDYDYLLLAAGRSHFYFGHPEWEKHAPGLTTVPDALEIRKRLLLAYERAEQEPDPEKRRALLTFVIVGAGPTGVELAGAVAEMGRRSMVGDFRHIDPRDSRILLIEADDRVLGPFSPELSAQATRDLERLGVEVWTGKRVEELDETGVVVSGERIPARTVLWAAGVTASPIARSLDVPLKRSGKVIVEPDLSVPGHPDIFVAGDLAGCRQGDGWVPGLAPAAIQGGRHAGHNILARIQGRSTRPFRYKNRGKLATIGRAAAVAELPAIHLSGFVAWVAWLVVHVFFLIGFRNRFLVIFEWAYHYITFDRGVRLLPENAQAYEEGEAQ